MPLLVAPVAEGRELLKHPENDNGAQQHVVVGHALRAKKRDEHRDAALVGQIRRLGVPLVPRRERHDRLEQDRGRLG